MNSAVRMGVVWCLVSAMSASAADVRPPWVVSGKNGVVASDTPYASYAGMQILKAGGNAIDAAVAVSFALAVTRPYSTGLGGGGFMIAMLADGKVVVQDFRETAPKAATSRMYEMALKKHSERGFPSRYGYLAVGVPGLVAGRCQALKEYGTLPLKQVLAPAIDLATKGFSVDRHYSVAAKRAVTTLKENYWTIDSSRYIHDVLLNRGNGYKITSRIKQPELARLMEGIAKDGPGFFYKGPVAKAIAAEMKKHGGIITETDLATYKVATREALRSTYRDYEILTMPPPSYGGVVLAESLNILEALDFSTLVKKDNATAVHFQIEALKHSFADRAKHIGDPDFVKVSVSTLTSKDYAKRIAAKLSPSKTHDPGSAGAYGVPDDSGTSHFSISDKFGNVVVSTETINMAFGAMVAIDEWGLVLNNQMDDFVCFPGKPDAYGLVGSPKNAIAPGKRPLSGMCPTIVLKGKKPYLLLGASGGPRIPSSVLNVLLGVTDRGWSIEKAMTSLRPHHQWRPDELFFSGKASKAMRAALRKRGHTISKKRRSGIVQMIRRTKDGWEGACDPRKGGRPMGY